MSQLKPRIAFVVPVTITEERFMRVRARSAAEARERINAGKYDALGPRKAGSRGILLVGTPTIAVPEREQ